MKLKTRKTIAKRVHITKQKKILHRVAGKSHFNARESGKTTRSKRRDTPIAPVNVKQLKQAIPYL